MKGIEILMLLERNGTGTCRPFWETRSVTRGPTGVTPPKAGTETKAPAGFRVWCSMLSV